MTYHPDLRKSEPHLVVIELLRKLFDQRRYPCFRQDFIHPRDLVPMMPDVAETLAGRGFLAADPAGQSSRSTTQAEQAQGLDDLAAAQEE
jgi:hypothetical protein